MHGPIMKHTFDFILDKVNKRLGLEGETPKYGRWHANTIGSYGNSFARHANYVAASVHL